MHLRPGTYNIEIRESGQTRFAEKVYVAPGKTRTCILSCDAPMSTLRRHARMAA